MAEKDKEFELEMAFKELEEIIGKLESEEVPLKDSIALYGKGAKLLGRCRDELTGIEKEMIVIQETLSTDPED